MQAIVIGNDHYNTLNVIRALGSEDVSVQVVIETASSNSFVLKSKYIKRGFLVNKLDAHWIIETLALKNERIPVLATSDAIASFLDENFDLLNPYFILPSVRKRQGLLKKMMDKNIQLKYAKNAGFDIPKSIAVETNDYDKNLLKDCPFPCIIKPEESIGGSKNDFRICKDIFELENALKELSNRVHRVLVQEYIPNDEVILIAGLRTNDKKNYIFGEVNKQKNGKQLNNLGLNCFGVLKSDSEIADKCIEYVNSIDFHGLYSVEAVRKRTASTLTERRLNYFMEINLRTDGLLYFYTRAGINFPVAWVKSCYGLPVEFSIRGKNIYGMNEFLYIKSGLFKSLIKDVFKTDVFSTFSLKDLKPFVFRFIYHG